MRTSAPVSRAVRIKAAVSRVANRNQVSKTSSPASRVANRAASKVVVSKAASRDSASRV
jgi:hypothetical protein